MTQPSAPAIARLPLDRWHRARGARMEPFLGRLVPRSYGDPAAEERAARSGCGLLDRSFHDRLELRGEDRQRFLHGLLTCDVKALAPGQGAYGFFTAIKGQVLADVVVLALEDRLWLELPAGQAEPIAAHLRKYVVADRVEIAPLADMVPLLLLGPQLPPALAELALPAAPWSHARTSVLGTEVHAARAARAGAPALELWVSASIAGPFAEALVGELGVQPVGFEAAEVLRIEAGVGRFGQDFGPEHFPQETGAEAEGVSYTKGCYLGQEVVARIHYRGGVQRALRGLRFAGAEPPALGAAVEAAGETVGQVTSACRSARCGAIGLAVLHRKAGEVGATVEIAGDGRAEIVVPPFA
ncbi:MAG: YgfZ/GcvT domain-containing protein [Acidobacteriota bacterium]